MYGARGMEDGMRWMKHDVLVCCYSRNEAMAGVRW